MGVFPLLGTHLCHPALIKHLLSKRLTSSFADNPNQLGSIIYNTATVSLCSVLSRFIVRIRCNYIIILGDI